MDRRLRKRDGVWCEGRIVSNGGLVYSSSKRADIALSRPAVGWWLIGLLRVVRPLSAVIPIIADRWRSARAHFYPCVCTLSLPSEQRLQKSELRSDGAKLNYKPTSDTSRSARSLRFAVFAWRFVRALWRSSALACVDIAPPSALPLSSGSESAVPG